MIHKATRQNKNNEMPCIRKRLNIFYGSEPRQIFILEIFFVWESFKITIKSALGCIKYIMKTCSCNIEIIFNRKH